MGNEQKIELSGRIILVADQNYWPILLRIKDKRPDLDFKMVMPDEFLDLVSFRYSGDPIPELLKTGLDYSRAKKWLKILRVAKEGSHPKVAEYRKAIEPFITYDPYAQFELKRCKIAFFELQEDLELHGICKRKGLPYLDVTFEDFGFEKVLDEAKKTLPILTYRTKEEQFISLFSRIRKTILENPEKKNRIAIHVDEGGDDFHLKFASSMFDIPLFQRQLSTLRSNPKIASMLARMFERKTLDLETEEDSAEKNIVQTFIDRYGLMDLPFEWGYVDLEEILTSKQMSEMASNRGIVAFNNFILDPDCELYITDFTFDRFYKAFSDKNVLSDADLLEVGANPSYVLTLLDARLKKNFLCYSNVAFISWSTEHQKDKIYPSQFIEEFSKVNPDWKKASVKAEISAEGIFTTKGKNYSSAHFFDKAFRRESIGEYRSYDHSFKGLPEDLRPKFKQWSISKIEDYARCPFAFWAKRILPTKDQDFRFLWLGVLFHKVMERAYETDFDFEKAFAEGVEAYREEVAKKHLEVTPVEETYFLVYRDVLETIVKHPALMKEHMHYAKSLPEQNIQGILLDGEKSYRFTGAIDKLIFVGDPKGEGGYYYIGDYKTGNAEFKPQEVLYGGSIQLPMYHYLLEKGEQRNPLIQDYDFAGFGIQKINFSSLASACADNGFFKKSKYFKNASFSGVVLDQENVWRMLDDTGLKIDKKKKCVVVDPKKSSFFKAPFLISGTDQGDAFLKATGYSKTLEELEEVAVQVCLSIIRHIEDGDFAIAPTYSEKSNEHTTMGLSCGFCPYRDVCYTKGASEARKKYAYVKLGEKLEDDDNGVQ